MPIRVDLTDEELLLLDGKCSSATQIAVDSAKTRGTLVGLSEPLREMVTKIVEAGKKEGKLTYCYSSCSWCAGCGKRAGYVKYKSGRNKGRDNYDKPLSISGIEFNRGIVSVQNHISAGGCSDCVKQILPHVKELVSHLPIELPECLRGERVYKKFKNRKCLKCGWLGHEGQMRDVQALMGGYFKGGCPNCPAENGFMRSEINLADGYTTEDVS